MTLTMYGRSPCNATLARQVSSVSVLGRYGVKDYRADPSRAGSNIAVAIKPQSVAEQHEFRTRTAR